MVDNKCQSQSLAILNLSGFVVAELLKYTHTYFITKYALIKVRGYRVGVIFQNIQRYMYYICCVQVDTL